MKLSTKRGIIGIAIVLALAGLAWGGSDRHLEQVFNLRESALTATNQPIIPILIPEKNRATVARFLAASRSGTSSSW